MPGLQRSNAEWDKVALSSDSDNDSDSDNTRDFYPTGYEPGASAGGWGTAPPPPPPEAVAAAAPVQGANPPPAVASATPPLSPPDECWLGDEWEDLGRVASVLDRLDLIGWRDPAFEKAAAEGDGTKFHEILGRAAEAARVLSPYDPTCRSYWVRVDGCEFTKWSAKYDVARPSDDDVHGAFVAAAAATMRHFRGKGLAVVAAYTQSDEVSFLCKGPATLARGASDPSRRLVTLFASVFSKRFEQALRPTKPEAAAEAFFDARVVAAASRSAGLLAVVERRLDCTRNASNQALWRLHGVTRQVEPPPVDEALLTAVTAEGVPAVHARKALMAGSATADAAIAWVRRHEGDVAIDEPIKPIGRPDAQQRLLLAAKGTPWDTLHSAHRYGTCLFAGGKTGRHIRLRVPRTRAEAAALEYAIFNDERRDLRTLGDAHPEAPAARPSHAVPAPAVPVDQRSIGAALPPGFVRAASARYPALDCAYEEAECAAVALVDEDALGALLERVTRTVGLLFWATESKADNLQGPFRPPVLRFEEVGTVAPSRSSCEEAGSCRPAKLRCGSRRRPPPPRLASTSCSPHTRHRRIKKMLRARGASRNRVGSSRKCRASETGARSASRATKSSGAPRARKCRARRAPRPATNSSSQRSSRCARKHSPRPSLVRCR